MRLDGRAEAPGIELVKLNDVRELVKARTITDVETDWDRGHNMAITNILAHLEGR